ncbi:MAG TPA: AgmX/PglI C-terminal domain-containing protein, partial [Myxococcota bacterium]|nr:AgmX/PglI C-terminal domain-containing protein [Myxococcota bacterium]
DARQRTSQTSGLLDGPPDAVTQDIEIFKEQQRQAGRGHDLTPVLGSTSELAGQAGRSETGESARRGHGRTQDAVQLRTHDAVQLRTQDAMRLRTHEFEGQAPRAEPTQAEVSNPAWHTTSIRAEGYQDAYRSEAHEHGQHDDDHDDHDDEDEHFEAPYSLAKRVLSDAGGTNAGPQTCIELMAVVSDKVTDFALLRPGSVTWSRASKGAAIPGLKSLKHQRDGNCLVVCDEAVTGSLKRAGQNLELHHFFQSQGPQGCRGLLKRGELLNIQGGRTSYFIRHVNPPPVPPDDRSLMEKLGLDGAIFNVAIASFLAHALIGIAITALTPEEQPPPKSEEFVVAVKQEPQLEEPKPEPPKPPEPPAPPTPPAPPQKTKPDRAPRPRRMAKPSPVRAQAPVPAPPGILGLLSKKGSTQAPGPAAAVAAVSNLSAVKVPGNQGSFRVSGLIGKLPSSSGISVGGGGGALVTKGANALLRGGGGGAGKLAGIGPRQVGGMVQKVPRGMHMGGGGSLDRASIERVVNQHADEIQRCYERELLKDSSLAGKVQVEWIIDTGGNVPSVRQVFSSAKSVGVVRCIMDSIKTWKFPKPQGGSVVVDFPFILKGMDF